MRIPRMDPGCQSESPQKEPRQSQETAQGQVTVEQRSEVLRPVRTLL